MLCLTETWLWNNEEKSRFEMIGFKSHHNCAGKGKEVSVYYKPTSFRHIQDVTEDNIQLTKLLGKDLDVIIVYKGPSGKDAELQHHLHSMIDFNKSLLVLGDFNMCFIDNRNNRSTKFLLNSGFKQLVHEATHINGGHIDHVYLRTDESMNATVELYSPYYTAKDHDALCVSFPDAEE